MTIRRAASSLRVAVRTEVDTPRIGYVVPAKNGTSTMSRSFALVASFEA